MDDPVSPARSRLGEPPSGPRLLRVKRSGQLFLHWPIDAAVLRPHVPRSMSIDTCKGQAWIGLTPFQMAGVRPVAAPAVPGLSSFLELSLRTYVTYREHRGVHFFSLDASSPVAVWLARKFFHLPYFRARMQYAEEDGTHRFSSRRNHRGARGAEFECAWSNGPPLQRRNAGEWIDFLTERCELFVQYRGRIYSSTVWHDPLTLSEASVHSLHTTMFEAAGLPAPREAPLAHHCHELVMDVWPQRELIEKRDGAALFDPALAPPPVSFS